MAALTPASTRPQVEGGARSRDRERIGYADTIKGIVVAGVIVVHAGMTYGLIGVFAYQEIPTGELDVRVALVLAAVATLGMGILFLIAGLFTPAALARKGAAGFVRGRLLRLGLPALAYLVVVMPALNLAGQLAVGKPLSESVAYTLDRLRQADLGPAWFLLALLLFTLAYVAWHAPGWPGLARGGVPGGRLLAIAVLSAGGMFMVRIVQPVTDPAPLNFGVWPQHLAFFSIGILAADGWKTTVPRAAVRQAKLLALAGSLSLAPLALAPPGLEEVAGGWHWQSALLCLGESLATLGFTIWLFRQFQRLRVTPLRRFTRASFPAYLLQSPATVLFGISMRPLQLPVGLKMPLLASLTLVACFGTAAFLRRRPEPRRTMDRSPAG